MQAYRRHLGQLFTIGVIAVLVSLSGQVYASEPLVSGAAAKRLDNGSIVITGTTQLPVGTQLCVSLPTNARLVGQTKCVVDKGGHFEAGNFTNGGKAWPAGSYKVRVLSYFTKLWQPSHVLAQVGENGARLPPGSLVPDDPEFPKSSGHLDVTVSVTFPEIALNTVVIQAVQESKLNVVGKGRSAFPVKEVVEYFIKGGGFRPLSWSARRQNDDKWVVTLDCIDAGKKKQAQWSYNPKTREVKYLDPLAKLLSWWPAH